MKRIATAALVLMAVLFVVGFSLQTRYPSFAYLRAFAEGGMVGALADWFAVTALFRRPLGLPIPHTAIIPAKKDELGKSLSEFVEVNFLDPQAVTAKLEATNVAESVGAWLGQPASQQRLLDEASRLGTWALDTADGDEVRTFITTLVQGPLTEADWCTPLGTLLNRVMDSDAHQPVITMVFESAAAWLETHPESFEGLASGRLPGPLRRVFHSPVDKLTHQEAMKFLTEARTDASSGPRVVIDEYLRRLATQLISDEEFRTRFDSFKRQILTSDNLGTLANTAWESMQSGLAAQLNMDASDLRTRVHTGLATLSERLVADPVWQGHVNNTVTSAAANLVVRYSHDIASIITDTVDRWDAEQTSTLIENLVGKDLQYIRLNGTFVGALAGLLIFVVAHALLG
jgi:uncharacterized membrane-anchored protein YjiN (DUF445 family)